MALLQVATHNSSRSYCATLYLHVTSVPVRQASVSVQFALQTRDTFVYSSLYSCTVHPRGCVVCVRVSEPACPNECGACISCMHVSREVFCSLQPGSPAHSTAPPSWLLLAPAREVLDREGVRAAGRAGGVPSHLVDTSRPPAPRHHVRPTKAITPQVPAAHAMRPRCVGGSWNAWVVRGAPR